jgi:3-oxoacyl-[acyl-carrier protein] reductase
LQWLVSGRSSWRWPFGGNAPQAGRLRYTCARIIAELGRSSSAVLDPLRLRLDAADQIAENEDMTAPGPPDDIRFDLDGRVAVVTGSSRGIGRAIALRLAAAGADCLVHTRSNLQGAEEVAAAIRTLGRETKVVEADLSEASDQNALVTAAFDWRDDVDMWINNAGADVLTGEAAAWPFEKKLEALWRVDVVATMRIARQVGQRMKSGSRGGGTILNMGWDQAETGMAGDSGEMFAAVKGAVMAFTRSLARSLAPEVRVNCLAPGWIRTEWGQQASESWQQRAAGESLLGRWGTPADVARAAHFLVSSGASFVNGQIVPINGGLIQGGGGERG